MSTIIAERGLAVKKVSYNLRVLFLTFCELRIIDIGAGPQLSCFPWYNGNVKRELKSHNRESDLKRIIIAFRLYASNWRIFFEGFLSFANRRGDWDIRLLSESGDLTAETIEEAERNGVDGILLGGGKRVDLDRLVQSPIPLAVCDDYPELRARRTDIVRTTTDPWAIGAMGLRHLMARGRRAIYAYVRDGHSEEWAFLRQKAFIQAAQDAGVPCVAYSPPPDTELGEDVIALRDWLVSLPMPIAVMASDDRRAAQVIAACRAGGLAIPDEVSILGVDNDHIIVDNTRPTLSSIMIDDAGSGYRVAAELDRLIRAKDRPCPEITVLQRPLRVAARESTRHVAMGDILARRIAEYIDTHVSGRLEVADVVRDFGCSRRYAEQSFRKAKKQTVHDYIVQRRVEGVRRRLS